MRLGFAEMGKLILTIPRFSSSNRWCLCYQFFRVLTVKPVFHRALAEKPDVGISRGIFVVLQPARAEGAVPSQAVWV
jgi:hypothetical protein